MYHTALLVAKTQEKSGVYTVRRIENGGCPIISPFSQMKSQLAIELTVEELQISGWVNSQTLETLIELQIYGTNLGTFHGIASNKLQIDLDLHFLTGNVTLELNAFDEIWVHVDIVGGVNGLYLGKAKCKRSLHVQTLTRLVCEPWV
ncbi:hypothetical protein BJY01DRAFT_245376 [Aspergillus pseudoustus]|uniref:Cyanovirin-N domain-containing protein n=1 Tax=Aspergillus pseudoustus TaxID=1810923 RepID=A0ABR4KEI9_9EURO